MRTSKAQAPSSKEVPNPKLQSLGVELASVMGWEDQETGPLILCDAPVTGGARPFDFGERTAQFGEAIVKLSKKIPLHPANNRLIDQLVGAGTSIGVNYCEANESVSKKDFRFSISRCLKEAKETRFFLRMIAAAEPQLADEARRPWRETTELLRILSVMKWELTQLSSKEIPSSKLTTDSEPLVLELGSWNFFGT